MKKQRKKDLERKGKKQPKIKEEQLKVQAEGKEEQKRRTKKHKTRRRRKRWMSAKKQQKVEKLPQLNFQQELH